MIQNYFKDGKEKAFQDLITINVNNCISQNGNLLYLFTYFYKDPLQIQEERNYLTKYISNNQISTLLPPGNIIFSILVKDESEIVATFTSQPILISKSEYDIQKYKDFLKSQLENIRIIENDKKYEQMLCEIGLMIESIVDFESKDDILIDEVIGIKYELFYLLNNLPFLIPNDLISQQLQEYVLRCLNQLLNTRFVLSSQNKFDALYSIIDKKVQQIKQLNLQNQDVKITYKKQMILALEMISQYMKDINQTPQDLMTWNEKQIQSFSNIQNILSQTLNINEERLEWKSDFIKILVQRVDSQILIKEYLKQFPTKQVYYDQYLIFDVKKQYWAENIYAHENNYKEQITPFYKNATENIKQELDRVHPAININISSYFNNLEVHQVMDTNQLVLPDNSQIIYQFDKIEGDGVVVCTQKIRNVWSTKQCKTSIEKNGNTFKVVCICPSPSYTTLMYDLETLFESENVKDIFSEDGINNIFSLDKWYEYAAIYTIVLINAALIIGIKIVCKIDKLGIQNHSNLIQTSIAVVTSQKIITKKNDKLSLENNKQNQNIDYSKNLPFKDKNKSEGKQFDYIYLVEGNHNQ